MAEGRCNCGGIKVSIPALPEKTMICYCSNCRRAGSTIGSLIYLLDKSEVNIKDPNGNLKSYKDSDTKSGKPITRQFCGNCGCPIATLISDDSPIVVLKSGLFEHIPAPADKSFAEEEPSWIKILEPGEKRM
ncbi:hypothetical protein COCC4DRAFT_62517 [Bipolaris maydis ATCC 48331]|uniref:CENP-V/GFA domain-containing protein n=2 Tax=Cochliobolus heterostrophus TaxID=5016 RepID=M2SQZ9_COCH5|nr:uncharacterized protein COCC4DRAFT_62517 [Bipolaris maydis ATCC 48331]EMD87740.1 hypothetical protein COCHEDRAFT_1196890 [Bipolaris maydis C5]KAJ5024044.1 Mss4-like protein [Bipolaris maydis]ENI03253.1 hypothetical protein COCC4DRAFT_62517 [Bipolaris maydis ATCC 48331]KAJ5057429.1 Mss4-like protein [Bipolaris maydis]KAJ6194686.1 Mss4-like protein [Bipolaris maydis]